MKYMKLGTRPDTFYTEEATRTVLSDVPADLVILINNTKYLLHKFPLLLKCGLLQRLCSDPDDSNSSTTSSSSRPIVANGFPGGEESFELCAKFCYNIAITLSAHNFLAAFSAAQFLLMTDSVSRPNLIPKLHTFFISFILPNWKDSVATLISTVRSPEFSDQTIIRPLIDSIVSKILTPPSQITWSFTYSRPPGRSVPKDWWTEDIADLDINHFRSIISAVRSAKSLPPALIGEALHVYAIKNLPDPDEISTETLTKHRRVLESIVSMIPAEMGAVSGGFLMRLLNISIAVGASASVKAELVKRSGRQLDEVSVRDLVLYRELKSKKCDVGVVEALVECFLEEFRRRRPAKREEREGVVGKMGRVAKVFDEYLGVIAGDKDLKVGKFEELVELLPEVAREEHDGLYQAIDTFLEEHPDLSKAERRRLCKVIDCRKLSPDVCSHAIANDRLPLRTLVQLLFIEQERAGGSRGSSIDVLDTSVTHEEARRSRQGLERQGRGQREEAVDGGKNVRATLESETIAAKKGSIPKPKIRGEAKEEKKIAARRV